MTFGQLRNLDYVDGKTLEEQFFNVKELGIDTAKLPQYPQILAQVKLEERKWQMSKDEFQKKMFGDKRLNRADDAILEIMWQRNVKKLSEERGAKICQPGREKYYLEAMMFSEKNQKPANPLLKSVGECIHPRGKNLQIIAEAMRRGIDISEITNLQIVPCMATKADVACGTDFFVNVWDEETKRDYQISFDLTTQAISEHKVNKVNEADIVFSPETIVPRSDYSIADKHRGSDSEAEFYGKLGRVAAEVFAKRKTYLLENGRESSIQGMSEFFKEQMEKEQKLKQAKVAEVRQEVGAVLDEKVA